MTPEELVTIIEKLAVDFVMIDHTETEELQEIVTCLDEINLWAVENNQPVLRNASWWLRILTEKLINKTSESPDMHMDIIGRAISEIQVHARNNFDFSAAVFPDELKSEAVTDDDNNNETLPSDTYDLNGLKHPGVLPGHIDHELYAEFLSLQPKILDKMEALILSIEQEKNSDSVNELKRLIHTTKGEAGFLNLDDVERLYHQTEDLFETIDPEEYTDLLFAIIDWIRSSFYWYQGSTSSPPEGLDDLLETINEIKVLKPPPPPEIDIISVISDVSETIGSEDIPLKSDVSQVYRNYTIYTEPVCKSAIELIQSDPSGNMNETLLTLKKAVCQINSVAEFMEFPGQKLLATETDNLLNEMTNNPELQSNEYLAITGEAFDSFIRFNKRLDTAMSGDTPIKNDSEIPYLIARIRAALSGILLEADARVSDEDPFSDQAGTVSDQDDDFFSTSEKETQDSISDPRTAARIKETINVDAERLDRIIDMIGELVIAESMISQDNDIKSIQSQKLTRQISQMDKITRDLQETGLSLRMLPIKATFSKMARIVRDTAKKADKDVRFAMSGEDTELDKTVVDKIGDPLMHMIRNAVDHGIEDSPEERTSAGKPEYGTVTIRAFHKGGNILIEIEDDGRGLNKSSILEKAHDLSLITDSSGLNDREIYNLIFEPGFSTAGQVTGISGRGVGMNVVKANIESLQGKVDIRSEPGKGSVFTIRIPLTLAIIDGMVVRIGRERYIIPTLSIVTSNRIEKPQVSSVFRTGEMINVQGNLVPLFVLSTLFEIPETQDASDFLLAVVVEENDQQVALVVDELIGKQQIVIKPLGEGMKQIMGISGAAIMPDGKVGLIIDVSGIIKLARNHEHQRSYSHHPSTDINPAI